MNSNIVGILSDRLKEEHKRLVVLESGEYVITDCLREAIREMVNICVDDILDIDYQYTDSIKWKVTYLIIESFKLGKPYYVESFYCYSPHYLIYDYIKNRKMGLLINANEYSKDPEYMMYKRGNKLKELFR